MVAGTNRITIAQTRAVPTSDQSADEHAKLKEACAEFESLFIEIMMKSMRASVPKSALSSGFGSETVQGMLDSELSRSLARAGGIGLAEFLLRELERPKGGTLGGASKLPQVRPAVRQSDQADLP
ncbi:MAG: rod-binding protein [Firmicutes bacterium]|nr:rod-binding protein [Bacillota bacterium]